MDNGLDLEGPEVDTSDGTCRFLACIAGWMEVVSVSPGTLEEELVSREVLEFPLGHNSLKYI